MKQDIDLEEVLDVDANKHIRFGLIVLFCVFGVFGVWSYYAKLDTGVSLAGQVVVEKNIKIVQHLEGGIVEEIYVKDGDFVEEGDKLLKFSETKARSELESLEVNYYEHIAISDRLMAESMGKDKIVFSDKLNEIESLKREKLKSAQIEIFESRRDSLAKEEMIASKKLESLSKQILNFENIIKTKQRLLLSFNDEAREQEELFKERFIDKTKLRDINRKIDSIKSDILSAQTDIKIIELQMDEVRTQLEFKKESYSIEVKKQLRETLVSIESMRAKMSEIKDRLSRTILRASASGTVLELSVHTIGAVITPGKPIMKIVPRDSKLIVEAKLSPMHIDYVKVGTKADMTFPSFQLRGKFLKNIEGEVIFVAADITTDDMGNSFYTVRLIVDEKGKETLRQENLNILTGMPANVVIKIGQQTLLEYIVRPLTILINRAFLEE